MGKQSMGTPATAIAHRTDNKLYRLQSGQTPIVRPALHNEYGMDGFPNGMNAVVAVISYTGYDMEDAMILNKSSYERGFGYGSIYKSVIVDLKDQRGAGKSAGAPTLHFGLGRLPENAPARRNIDQDGLPGIGALIEPGEPIAGYEDDTTGRVRFIKYKGDEAAYIDTVRLLGQSYHLSIIKILSTDSSKRYGRRRTSTDSDNLENSSLSSDWRQIFVETWSEGSLFSKVAVRGYAIQRKWNTTRRNHQPTCLPQ